MRGKRDIWGTRRKRTDDAAVSEIIGALVLTAVIVGFFAIITAFIISQPPPVKLPATEFNLTIDDPSLSPHNVTISHKRGDSFTAFDTGGMVNSSHFYVKVDGQPWNVTRSSVAPSTDTFRLIKASGTDPDTFSSGDELIGPYSGDKPQQVEFIYRAPEGGEYLLWGTGDSGTGGRGNIAFTFTANPCNGTIISFSDTSTFRPTSWVWNFGDGTPNATGPNPSHLYLSCGLKTVTLTISDGVTSLSLAKSITVQPPRAVIRTDKTTVSTKEQIQFTDESYCKQAVQTWNFGDGTSSSDPNPTHAYQTTGEYIVSLTEGTGACTSTATQKITVRDCVNITGLYFNEPIFLSNDALFTEQFLAQYTTATQPVAFAWSFGDNTPNQSGLSPIHRFANAGIYRVMLTASNYCDSSTVFRDITVRHTPESCPAVQVSFTPPENGYAPQTVTLNATVVTGSFATVPEDSIIWNFGDGSLNATGHEVQHTFQTAGTYSITVSAVNDCGKPGGASSTLTVTCPTVIAGFTTSPSQGDAPLTVSFTDTTNNPVTITHWQWDFGDGSGNSTLQSPSHTFNAPGTYQVTLTAINQCGEQDSETQTITITCPPVTAGFSSSADTGIPPLAVTFTDTSSSALPITGWHWEFGDGTVSNLQSPSHTYGLPGIYQVNLTATNECGQSSPATHTITVTCPPVSPQISPNVSSGYAPLSILLNGSASSAVPITEWTWNFGDGTPGSALQSPVHTFTTPDSYPVTLTAKNACGVPGTTSTTITAICPPVTANFSSNVTEGYPPLAVAFTDSSTSLIPITSWEWNFGDGTTNATEQNPLHLFTTLGTFPVQLTATNSCGEKASVTYQITVTCPPVSPSFSANATQGYGPLTVAFTDTTSSLTPVTGWQWNFGDGTPNETVQNPTHTFAHAGVYTVTMTSTNNCANSGSISGVITVLCPPVTAGFTTNVSTGYPPLTVAFTDTSTSAIPISQWQWNFGDGTANATTQNPVHTFNNPGTYQVNLTTTNECGRFSTIAYAITVTCPPVTAGFTTNTTSGQAPLTVAFNDTSSSAIPVNQWQWDFGDGTANATTQNPVHTFTNPGTYQVNLTATNDCGQFSTIAYAITVTCPPVTAGFTTNTSSGTAPLTVAFTDTSTSAKPITEWQWNFGDGTANATIQNPAHTFTNPGTYQVTLTATNDCGQFSTIAYAITVTCPLITAGFTTNTSSGVAPLTVAFTDTSTSARPITQWQWNFGDGTTNATTQNPTHTFINPGTYQVTLTATNDCGRFNTIAYAITVTCPPITAGFTTNVSTGYPPLTVAFTDTSTSARPTTQWQWNFGDGTTNATTQNPTHTFINPGTYQVTLTATNDCGRFNTIAYAITVTCPPITAGFTTNVSTGYPPLTVTFTDTSTSARPITLWQWNFGDGTVNATTQNPTHTFINPGTYQVTLTAANDCGQNSGTSRVITVSSCYRIINASASTGGTISPTGQVQVTCGASQTFTITPASGYITTDVIVNGISQGSLATYTFTNVQQNHTIYAEFFAPTNQCAITGFVTNATTGMGVGGIRVEVYNQARTILLRSGVSQPNGYYEIIYQPQQGQRYDITSPDTATWVTTFPVSKWYDDILFNPGAKCSADNINFSGIQMVPSPGDFLYNAPKSAAIAAGGMIEFQISTPVNNNAYIIVNNVRSDFVVGDLITIRLLSAQNSGNAIYMSQNGEGHSITTFAFGNAAIYKNRSLLASGQINGINIPKAVSLISTLVLNIPAGQNAWTTFSWGGSPVFPTGQNSQGVTIYNLRPGTDGILNINLNNVYAQGAGDRYQLF